jgi:glycosyltransferase involved in cell wall biosynthesis
VRYVRQENRGLAGARNTGLREAQGTHVAFLDADDLWLPEKLERQLPLAFDGVLYADAYLLREGDEGEPRRIGQSVDFAAGKIFDELLDANMVPVLTAIVPRTLANRFEGFDESLRSAEDLDLWLRMAAGGVEFRYSDEPLAVYRIRPGSLSSDPVWMASHRLEVFRKVARAVDGDASRRVRRRIRRERHLLAGELRSRAWPLARSGRVAEARADLRAAFAAEPFSRNGVAGAGLSLVPPLLRAVAGRREP